MTISQKSQAEDVSSEDEDDYDDEESGEEEEDFEGEGEESEEEKDSKGQSPLTRMVSNANFEITQHLTEIEKLKQQLEEVDQEVQAMQNFTALKKDVKRH